MFDNFTLYAIAAIIVFIRLYIGFSSNSPPKWVMQKLQKLKTDFNGTLNLFSTLKGQFKGHSFQIRAGSDGIQVVLNRKVHSQFKLYISTRRLDFPLFMKKVYCLENEELGNLSIYSNDDVKSRFLLSNNNFKKLIRHLIDHSRDRIPVGIENLVAAFEKEQVTFEIARKTISASMKHQNKNLDHDFIINLLSRFIMLSNSL